MYQGGLIIIDELEFVNTPSTIKLFPANLFSIFEKLTCSMTSTFSEPVIPLVEFSQPTIITRESFNIILNFIIILKDSIIQSNYPFDIKLYN